jgi:hypothetical protein
VLPITIELYFFSHITCSLVENPGQKILDYWGPSKKVLGDMSFLANLKTYDRDNIPVSKMPNLLF